MECVGSAAWGAAGHTGQVFPATAIPPACHGRNCQQARDPHDIQQALVPPYGWCIAGGLPIAGGNPPVRLTRPGEIRSVWLARVPVATAIMPRSRPMRAGAIVGRIWGTRSCGPSGRRYVDLPGTSAHDPGCNGGCGRREPLEQAGALATATRLRPASPAGITSSAWLPLSTYHAGSGRRPPAERAACLLCVGIDPSELTRVGWRRRYRGEAHLAARGPGRLSAPCGPAISCPSRRRRWSLCLSAAM